MEWYCTKKYSPAKAEYCFVVSDGEINLANYEPPNTWSIYCPINNEFIILENVTHFCIPDPIPITSPESNNKKSKPKYIELDESQVW